MDGMEYISKDVEQHGQVTEVFFNTWDSMFQENKVMRTAKQEQETSQITFTILEREKKGLFGLRSDDVIKESFTLTYCYRTGRWMGDDFFGDSDGYGYYLGENYEIWFNIYQPDVDNDFIPYWMEINILGTDPTVKDAGFDPDGDSVSTKWEWKWGYDPNTFDDHVDLDPDMDSLTNIWEYKLSDYYADPFIENLYVEIDLMEREGFLVDPPTVFYEESKQALIERYAEHNIKAFFDTGWPNTPSNGGGQIVPYIDRLSQDSGMILQYYNNYFPDERKGGFIYLLLGYRVGGGFQHPAMGNVYDTIYIWDIPFNILTPFKHLNAFVGYGRLPTPRGVRAAQAGLTLHELGHFGGLIQDYFRGVDYIDFNLGGAAFDVLQGKETKETYGQYHSVMNYLYTQRHNLIDYSDGSNGAPYDFDDWANLHLGGWGRPAPILEEAYYLTYGEKWEETRKHLIDKNISLIETPPITGYVYDENLTHAFEEYIGAYSPNTRWNVEWQVHRCIANETKSYQKDIKVLISPKDIMSTYHTSWSLFVEGDIDEQGRIILSNSNPLETFEAI